MVDNLELSQKIDSSLYYILSSIREGNNWPTGPGGVQTDGYWGQAAWDNEMF